MASDFTEQELQDILDTVDQEGVPTEGELDGMINRLNASAPKPKSGLAADIGLV